MAQAHEKTLAALKAALQMETDGKKFYQAAARSSANKLGKKLLEKLAAEEDIHQKVFQNIYDTISARKGWPKEKFTHDSGRGLRTIFAQALEEMDKGVKAIPSELDAVQTAMTMENKTYDFYKKQVGLAGSDSERQFYEALAVQEEEHHRILLDYYEFLKNPGGWFVQKEHPSLDGG